MTLVIPFERLRRLASLSNEELVAGAEVALGCLTEAADQQPRDPAWVRWSFAAVECYRIEARRRGIKFDMAPVRRSWSTS
jgi:hypothetical protein